jgi:hypothetical protein
MLTFLGGYDETVRGGASLPTIRTNHNVGLAMPKHRADDKLKVGEGGTLDTHANAEKYVFSRSNSKSESLLIRQKPRRKTRPYTVTQNITIVAAL